MTLARCAIKFEANEHKRGLLDFEKYFDEGVLELQQNQKNKCVEQQKSLKTTSI